jgi:hypothetical protein
VGSGNFYIYLLIFIYHFNFSGSHGCNKLTGLRDVMLYSLVHAFRHFAKTTHPSTEQTKEGLKSSASTWGQQVHSKRPYPSTRKHCLTSQKTVVLVKTFCCSSIRIRYFIEDGKSLELSEVLQENGDIYRGADKSLARPGRKQATSMSKSSRLIGPTRAREYRWVHAVFV